MAKWTKGWSWTKGQWHRTEMPTNMIPREGYPKLLTKELYSTGGPFYYNPTVFDRVFFAWGARPTPTWAEGYGNEGLLGFVGRWTKRHGFGNWLLIPTIKKTEDRHRT